MTAPVGLWIDWDKSGFGSSVSGDCTTYVMNARYSRGGSPEITGAAQVGSATFILKNPNGLFTPTNTSSPLYGLLTDGVRVWFGVNEDGTVNQKGATVRGRFAGYITEITPIPEGGAGSSTPTVEIICEDALGWYGRKYVSLGDDCSGNVVPPRTTSSNIVVGFLNAQIMDASALVPTAWTSLGTVGQPGGGFAGAHGLIFAQGPGTTGSSQSFTWLQTTNQLLETAAMQIGGITGAAAHVTTTTSASGGGNGAILTRSITVTSDGAGYIAVAIWIHNFDSGAQILTPPTGFVVAYQTSLSGYNRDYGMVCFGYLPVTTAGSNTLDFVMSNSYDDWWHDAIGCFYPAVAESLIQDTVARAAAAIGVTGTLPNPL